MKNNLIYVKQFCKTLNYTHNLAYNSNLYLNYDKISDLKGNSSFKIFEIFSERNKLLVRLNIHTYTFICTTTNTLIRLSVQLHFGCFRICKVD